MRQLFSFTPRGQAVRIALAALLALLCSAPVGAEPIKPASDPTDIVPGTILIGVDEQASEDQVRSLAIDVGGSIERSHALNRSHVLRIPPGSETAAAQALAHRPHVRFAEPNYVRRLHLVPNDALFGGNQWNLARVSATAGWDVYPDCFQSCEGATANGPLVAVVDSGVDLGHPDLSDRVTGAQDVNGHGTHVAGIIAAAANNSVGVAGLAFNARIAAYRACDQDGKCPDSDVVNSIAAAVNLGARVINLSLGGQRYSAALCSAVDSAVSAGVVVVASSGNDSVNGLSYPAACQGAIAVGSTDRNDVVASDSNGILAGDDFLIMAPGVNVTSTLPRGGMQYTSSTGYGNLSGTSMAAPHVSGLVALLRGLRPALSIAEVKQLLRDSADRIGGPYTLYGINCACYTSPRYGMGRINVQRALNTLVTRYGLRPRIQGITPDGGPVAGGTTISIAGQFFVNLQDVSFSDGTHIASAPSFTANSATSVSATTPSWWHSAITHVTVRTAAGASTASVPDADRFNYAPRIANVTPQSGPMTGGTRVDIEGDGFVPGATSTTFGLAQSPNTSCADDKHCVVEAPKVANPGNVPLTVVAGGVPSAPDSYTYLGPMINRIDPSIGPSTGGTYVHLYGVSFDPAMDVKFDGVKSTYVVCDDTTRCTARSPGGSGPVHITVKANGVPSTESANDVFTYAPFPTVSAVVPANGPATGGTQVTIIGTNFSTQPSATQLSFGPNAARNVSCTSSTRCTAISPEGLLSVDVTATVNNLPSEANAADKFGFVPVITSISPSNGPSGGGTTVTINGVGFADFQHWFTPASVSFGSAAARSFNCPSSTTCSAVSPAGAGVVDVLVGADGLTSDPTLVDRFSYLAVANAGWTPWYSATPGDIRGALAYDTVRNVVVYFGGGGLTGSGETWTFSGGSANWLQQAPTVSPQGRTNGSLTFDQARGTGVLFGGMVRRQVNRSIVTSEDQTTWLWDGMNWSAPSLSVAPPARHGASIAYDAAHGRVLLFGGCADVSCTRRLSDTWTWDGTAWTQQAPASSPAARAKASLAYDSTHGTLVLFGGEDANRTPLGDTWIWTGTNWIQQSPPTSPAPRQAAGLAYHPGSGGLLLFGGATATGDASDTWTWSGTTWSEQTAPTSPPFASMNMVYDALHQVVVMLGNGVTWTWSGS